MYSKDTKVVHEKFGTGIVLADLGDSVLVRFDNGIQSCLSNALEKIVDVQDALATGSNSIVADILPMLQAKCIKSVNDQWGVFSRSQIDLLPHQLWVCRQARLKEPCRMIVADDVGLGKTIEAGLILSAMLTSGKLHRMLILTPASLVGQWAKRMYEMFDIRAEQYRTQADTKDSNFWQMHDFVIASLDTLKLDNPARKERMLSCEPWDVVLVDEAHHLNNDPKMGATLGYELILEMQERKLIDSMLFFTGTPHKGKNFSFLSLLHLLAPTVFDPRVDMSLQLDKMKEYMVRNNKYNVTDLHGNLLFKEPIVKSVTYTYSTEEQLFYDKLTEFISSGMAYAGSLNRETGSIVMFVLITMQKLASSSVAAVTNALRRRISKFDSAVKEKDELLSRLHILETEDDGSCADEKAQVEERLLELSAFVQIGNNEKASLCELLSLAEDVKEETKIQTLMDLLEADYSDQNVLFFTEYKATQSMLLSKLMARYGEENVTIINGDERLDDVLFPDGSKRRVTIARTDAAREFNEGKRRFLISTEAAGEGIDLEECCHIIIHVDLPWNPMRLHQRVGRLNRYGQRERVEVLSMRNPDTVESRIWNLLNAKLVEIDKAFGAVMEEKEDITQLVLGMAPDRAIQDIFAQAPRNADDATLARWFDVKAATIGGKDIVKTVKDVFGNVSRFNYDQVSDLLPRVDLADLQSFFKNILSFRGRRLSVRDGALEFITPSEWMDYGVLDRYDGLVLNRKPKNKTKILGAGHKVFDKAINDALKIKATIAASASIKNHLLFFTVYDQVTDTSKETGVRYYACEIAKTGTIVQVLADWEVLKVLNGVSLESDVSLPIDRLSDDIKERCIAELKDRLSKDEFSPKIPMISLDAALLAVS